MRREVGRKLSGYLTVVAVQACLGGSPLAAEIDPIRFDHFGAGDRVATVGVDPGSYIEVQITHTCRSHFSYSFRGVTKQADEAARRAMVQAQEPAFDCLAIDSEVLRIPHESKYGGYVVEVESKATKSVRAFLPNAGTLALLLAPESASDTLADLRNDSVDELAKKGELKTMPARLALVISVESKTVDFAFAGGFSVSELTDRRYAVVRKEVNGEELDFAVRDRDAEDDYKLGLTAMIHGRHVSWKPWIAASFGLGVGSSGEVNYFVGPSFRLGDQGFLTLGYQFGPVKRLPNGVRETDLSTPDPGRALSDPNVLNDLPTKTEGALFFSFSYTFLGSGLDAFKKPFAPAKDAKEN